MICKANGYFWSIEREFINEEKSNGRQNKRLYFCENYDEFIKISE